MDNLENHKRAFYLHFKHGIEAKDLEEAKRYAKLYTDIIDCLAEKFSVYVRADPVVSSEKLFESNEIKHFAYVRFSVTYPEVSGREPGKICGTLGEGYAELGKSD